jgi:nucleoside phosphorylase
VALMCAVPTEERMLRRFAGPGVRVIATGMGTGPAERTTTEAIAQGVTAAISVGFCGALDPSLERGDVVVPEAVHDAATGDTWECDASLTSGAGPRRGVLVTAPGVVGDPAARSALAGLAVDMESAGTARACARAGIPFAAIRAVTDRAGDVLPHLDGVVDERGVAHPMRVLAQVARHPSQLGAWMALGRGARAAGRGLTPAVAGALGREA